MDPVTAALNLANTIVTFAAKVWEQQSPEQRTQAADDWAKFNHNIAQFLFDIQSKIKLPQ